MITAGSKQCSILIGIRFWQWKKSGISTQQDNKATRFLERLSIAVKHLSTGGPLGNEVLYLSTTFEGFLFGKGNKYRENAINCL